MRLLQWVAYGQKLDRVSATAQNAMFLTKLKRMVFNLNKGLVGLKNISML